MSTAVQRRRGTTAQHSTFTGLPAETTVDTTKNVVVVHDGVTPGGHPLAPEHHEHVAADITDLGTAATHAAGDFATAGHTHDIAQIGGAGAGAGQVPTWDGDKWVPETPSSAAVGVTSFNGRNDVVTLEGADVTGALGFTPSATGHHHAVADVDGLQAALDTIEVHSQVLTDIAANAPTKTGGGASGTWGISITGNAATATHAGSADTATNSTYAQNAVNADHATAADSATNATNASVLSGKATINSGAAGTGPAFAANTVVHTAGWATPYAGRVTIGDGTGWKYTFGKWSGGAFTDTFTFADYGDFTAAGTIKSNSGGFSFPDGTTQSTAASQSIPSGTVMLFAQASAPTGWTKRTDINDYAMRVVSGGSGGSVAGSFGFSSIFGSRVTAETTLSASQMPSHNHSYQHTASNQFVGYSGFSCNSPVNAANGEFTDSTGAQGGGASHSHALEMRIAYLDVILATKN